MPGSSPFSIEEVWQAWERVAENDGCAGVDRETVERFARHAESGLRALLEDLSAGRYRAMPLLPIVAEKRPGSSQRRTFLVPAVRDRILQTAAARQLSKSFEPDFLDANFAYRRSRGVDSAIARICQWRDRGYSVGVDADISSFFDSVPHRLLLDRLQPEMEVPGLGELVAGWVHAWVWNGKRVRRLTRGLPQGSPLSPVLANFFLSPLDAELEQGDCRLVRYADDFLILAQSPSEAQAASRRAGEVLKSLRLELNWSKTTEVSFEHGFNFLGAWFHGTRVYLPWRMGPKPKGKILEITRPMPARTLAAWKEKGETKKPQRIYRQMAKAVAARPGTAKEHQHVANIYVTEQGAIVRKSGERLLIEKDSKVELDLPYHKLESVLLFGNVQITAHAMGEMLGKGVTMSIFSRFGSFLGALVPRENKNIQLRIAHHDLYRNEARCLAAATRVVDAKLANCIWVLERYRARRGEGESTGQVLVALQEARKSLEAVKDHGSLLGIEGAAARSYFEGLMQFNSSGFRWLGRKKHPATDPVNSLLSLTYTLLTQELNGLSEAAGLEPGLGVLHEPEYGRPSLALDLLEPFRAPVADRFVMALLNRGSFAEADFEQPGPAQPCHLTHDALKRYFAAWEKWMLGKEEADNAPGGGYRRILREEVRKFALYVREGGQWSPFLSATMTGNAANQGDTPWNTSSVTI